MMADMKRVILPVAVILNFVLTGARGVLGAVVAALSGVCVADAEGRVTAGRVDVGVIGAGVAGAAVVEAGPLAAR
ncbi:MAG: hypothetical protein EBQ96_00375 [Proteobacteria bacterium]|nr:hypothetical protein [Pseudomonadota bacterium]